MATATTATVRLTPFHPAVSMDTTITIRMLARLMDITDLTGSQEMPSLAQGRGIAAAIMGAPITGAPIMVAAPIMADRATGEAVLEVATGMTIVAATAEEAAISEVEILDAAVSAEVTRAVAITSEADLPAE